MVTIFTDADAARLTPAVAIATMRDAVLAAHGGQLAAPPRTHVDLAGARLAITAGRSRDWFGYRAYWTGDLSDADQLIALHDATGRLTAVYVGERLGQYRVGALGAVAVDAIARPDAGTLGIVGTGNQAYAQAWAIRAVRPLSAVTVYGRDPRRRAAFAARLRDELGLPATAAGSAEAAVRDRDIVVLATSSPTPVIDAGWLAPGTSVTTLGPKQVGRAEFDAALADAAALLVTDSPAQVAAYDPPFVLTGTPAAARLTSLGALLASHAGGPGETSGNGGSGDQPVPDDALRLYCSVGLAGTGPALLAALALGTGSV